MEINEQAVNICDVLLNNENIITKQDDSEYWIVRNEYKMNDGWLVVSND